MEKTTKPSEQQPASQPGQTAKPTAPTGAQMSQPGNPPAETDKGSKGFDPVGSAGQQDGQKGRPEKGTSPDDANQGKPFQTAPVETAKK